GILGHYVGDGSQPLHLTIHYNGWAATVPNPKHFTTDQGIHNRYEAAYVNATIDANSVRRNVGSPQRLVKVWDSIKQYLSQTFMKVIPLNELERGGDFNPARPAPKGRAFFAANLPRAGAMRGAFWYTAWLEGGDPPAQLPAQPPAQPPA